MRQPSDGGGPIAYSPAAMPDVKTTFDNTCRIVDCGLDQNAQLVAVTFPSESGFLFDIEASNDPGIPGGWDAVASDVAGQSGRTTHQFSNPDTGTADHRFYRVRAHRP